MVSRDSLPLESRPIHRVQTPGRGMEFLHLSDSRKQFCGIHVNACDWLVSRHCLANLMVRKIDSSRENPKSVKLTTTSALSSSIRFSRVWLKPWQNGPHESAQVKASVQLAFNLRSTCDDLRWLWSSSNSYTSWGKFFIVWLPNWFSILIVFMWRHCRHVGGQ